MATYFLSCNVLTGYTAPTVATTGAAPTADIYVAIGGGNAPQTTISRDEVCRQLDQIKAYIRGDDPRMNGGNVLKNLVS